MRSLALTLCILIAALQYPMWLGKGGWLEVRELDRRLRCLDSSPILPNVELRVAHFDPYLIFELVQPHLGLPIFQF